MQLKGREVFLQKEKLDPSQPPSDCQKNLRFSKNTCLVARFSKWHESGPHFQEQVGWGTWLLLSRLLTFVFPASGQQDVQKLTLTKVRWSIYQDRGSWLQSISPQILKDALQRNIGAMWSSPMFIVNINRIEIYFFLKVNKNKASSWMKLKSHKNATNTTNHMYVAMPALAQGAHSVSTSISAECCQLQNLIVVLFYSPGFWSLDLSLSTLETCPTSSKKAAGS